MTVSPQVKLFALVALLAGLAAAGGMLFLSRAQSEAAAAVPLPAPVVTRPAPAAPKPAAKPRNPVVAENGLPRSLVAQLRRHEVVVAAVYAGGAPIDTLARDEARAGASDVHAGFAALDVSDKRIALALAERAETLTAPAVLVFGRDGEVKARLDGFADRMLVAQLVSSAR